MLNYPTNMNETNNNLSSQLIQPNTIKKQATTHDVLSWDRHKNVAGLNRVKHALWKNDDNNFFL